MVNKYELKIGIFVTFNARRRGIITGKFVKRNPKYALLDCGERGMWKVPYSALTITKDTSNYVEAEKIHYVLRKTQETHSLKQLMEEVKIEYESIFDGLMDTLDLQSRFDSVRICWNNQKTYRRAGKYRRLTNEITISISLKEAPKEFVKYIIYHELLHIKIPNHSYIFRHYEEIFKHYDSAKEYINELFSQIRAEKLKL